MEATRLATCISVKCVQASSQSRRCLRYGFSPSGQHDMEASVGLQQNRQPVATSRLHYISSQTLRKGQALTARHGPLSCSRIITRGRALIDPNIKKKKGGGGNRRSKGKGRGGGALVENSLWTDFLRQFRYFIVVIQRGRGRRRTQK